MRTGLFLLLIGLFFFWAAPLPATADGASATLVATADSTVDATQPDVNFNARPLAFELSTRFDSANNLYCPALTRLSYMRFDLAAVDFAIAQARLIMTSQTCSAPETPLQLFVSDNLWTEDGVTWNNRPAMQFLFPDASVFEEAGRIVWTDDGSDSLAQLADWLAFAQATGVQSVTLGIITPITTGCTPVDQPAFTLLFEDREHSSSGSAPCVGVAEPPLLQLAAADGTLPERAQGPTAVALSARMTATPGAPGVLLLAYGLLVVLTLVGVRRR